MMATVDLQNASASEQIPPPETFTTWVDATLTAARTNPAREVSIRIVDSAESQDLNQRYRGKDRPTNVLSFPCHLPAGVDIPLLGDLVICAEIVTQEAHRQRKLQDSHWAHMVVHGTLHLLGYDHTDEAQAERMESLETHILAALGHPSPYSPQ